MENVEITKDRLLKLLNEDLNDEEQAELIEELRELIQSWEGSMREDKKSIEATMAIMLKRYLQYTNNMDRLKYYWDNSSADSEPRKILESRMVEILASISGAEEWFYFWENVPCDSQTGSMSDSERADILKGHLSNTTDMRELACFLESILYRKNDSIQRKLINDRISEVLKIQLPRVNDIGELAHFRHGVGSEPVKLINDRIVEVLAIQLPSIDDMNKLMFFWGELSPFFRGFPCSLRELIEARMAEVLPCQLLNIDDIDKLILFWSNISINSKPKELIEDRMVEVLPNYLLEINDMCELKCLWGRISFPRQFSVSSKPREMIENKMVSVLEDVKLENTPSWFVDVFKNKFFLPDFLREHFLKKVKNLAGRS